MANTALNGPAHRIMRRTPPGNSGQPLDAAPSLDMGGSGIQDSRLQYNTANSATGAQIIGWMGSAHPFLDVVPSTASQVAIAAAQVPTGGTHLNLVTSTGAGITVSSSATVLMPSFASIPTGSLFIDSVPLYRSFGTNNFTVLYDAATMLGRCIQIHSVGDDHLGTMALSGWDIYGFPQHETVTLTNAGTATSKKAFKALAAGGAVPGGTLSGSNVSLGQADTFGLPLLATGASAIWGFWNNLILAGTGTFTAAVTTNPATAITGDVRGTFIPGSASDGTKRLTLWQHSVISQMVTSGINIGLFGVPTF